jgi:TolB-like protein/Tfp pilus assembly protein PilF
MASIFLSYAREDAPKAKALAHALERAGHSVWWDRHIHGGSEYAGEIEAALGSADVIIVLWSETSLRSAWVRDEAAEGRDSGRLVPLTIDDCSPPLGFRQLQTIPIGGWSGRGNPPHFQEVLAAISARAGVSRPDAPARPTPDSVRKRQPLLVGLAALGALIIAIGGWWLLEERSQASATPVLAVLPFSDLSPERDKAYLAEGVAEAILTVLAKESGIRVLGRSSAQQLQAAGSEAVEMRRALGITHVLEGSARSVGNDLRMSVRLINAADGQQVWAEEYSRRLDNIFAVQDEIGRAVAQKLRGSFGGVATAQPITKADTYALYLAARSKMRDRRQSSLTDALKLAQRVIAADPNYAPGHALLAELVWHLSSDNYGTIPEAKAKAVAQRHARRAVQLAPDAADGYAALGLSLGDTEDAIEPLTRAIALDSSRAELRQWLGHSLVQAGRQAEALSHFNAAVEMDPLWNPGAMLLAYTLAASERIDEAEKSVAEFERRGGSRAVATKIRGDIANYRGDYSEGARLTELALAMDPETPQADLSAGWYFYMLGLNDRGAGATKRLPHYTRLLMSGRQTQLLSEVRAAGAGIWQQPDPFTAIEALTYARDWRTINTVYDANRDIVGVICKDGEAQQMGLNLAIGLENMKRAAESVRIRRCVREMLELQGRGPIRSPYLPTGALDILWAQLHALDGNSTAAFSRMSRSIDRGVRTPYMRGLSDLPAFDRFKEDPRYRQIDTRLKRLIAVDRAEYLRQKRAA